MVLAMTRIVPALALIAAAFVAAAPAAAAERTYSVTDFDRIVVEGPFTVRLATGRPSAARATGSVEALERVTLDVQGRTLRIRPNRSAWGGYPGAAAGTAAIEVSARELRSATVSGPATLTVERVRGLRVDLAVEGSGTILAADVAADNLVIGLIGSGRIRVAGTAGELRASIHGWADLDASALVVQGANITTDTSGRVAVGVAREARVTAGGVGEVEIIGSPSCTVRGLSAAMVRCGRSDQR
jgi:hypothetical protein